VSHALAKQHVSTRGEAMIRNVTALTLSRCTFSVTDGSEVAPVLNPSAAP
jgi:hypothetical protein